MVWCMPLSEFPSNLSVWAAVIAFVVEFLTCLFSVNRESIHMPRYLMHLTGFRVLVSPSLFVGIVIDGPGPEWRPLLDFVKCISSHLT